jgi:hypothetical protein
MKHLKHIFLAVISGVVLTFTSCSEFMDLEPTTEYTEQLVFSDPALVQAYVNELYNNIQNQMREYTTDGLTDDAYFTHNYGQKAVNEATINESAIEWYDDDNNPFKWKNRYQGIRYANVILNNIDQVPVMQGYDLNRMRGEAAYMRAHMYHELVRGFGGVPLVLKNFSLNDEEEMKQARNTVGECLEQILKDLTVAEENLSPTVSDSEWGRVTRYVATGLKARIALQIASPLYADRTVNTLPVNQYTGDRMALYRVAKENAVKVIEEGPFSLVDCTGGINTERAEKFKSIITDKRNSEQMFVRSFMRGAGAKNSIGLQHGPNGYHNWAGTTPSQDLVMDFEYEDGSLPEGLRVPGDKAVGNPYNGREARYYATIASDGNEWGRPRPADAAGLDPTPLGRLQCGKYEVTDGDAEITAQGQTFKGMFGIDTRQGPIEDWNGSWTGYYEKKLIDTSVDAQYYVQEVPWTYMRLAEMYLIAAEACIELGELEEGAKYLDILRGRVGNVDTKTALTVQKKQFNQAGLREFVHHERRVELAYEGFRYHDVRRWMIAPVTNSKPLAGIEVIGRLKSGQTQYKPYIHNEEKYEYTYYVIDLSGREERIWVDKMYFAPIKREEMRRNPNLVQNPGME